MSESSFGAALTTLTKSGLLEQTGFNVYSPTSPATAWLESQEPLDLVLILHAKFLAMLELIPLLYESDKAPDLARAAHSYFGLTRVDVGGIRTRLQLLKAAGLISELANWRFHPTPLGERLVQEVPLQDSMSENVAEISVSDESRHDGSQSSAELLAKELEWASVDGESPVRLEKAAAEALSFLGFEARHVGGGGNTDVLATVESADGTPVRVIVDAKSARSGSVNEGAVSFDTLAEHKDKHEADYVVLVGPGFDSGRVRPRAEQHGVRLLSASDLGQLIRRHERSPLSASEFISLVDPDSNAGKSLEAVWVQAERRRELFAQIVAVLAQEAREADEVTKGALSPEQLYLIVRDELDPRPTTDDIGDVLKLLEHPLIGSVRRSTEGGSRVSSYRLVDSPQLVREKVSSISASLAGIDDDN
ncbi:hypothetical protein GCM10020260_21890 [Nesterenkonia halobia]|uniref:Restriction endonuclease n=2 Tax=Nesterenkonia halobia TaxID=37922 RepID=A0ABP6RG48_9MICC